jgi:hypothetical protein
MRRLLMIGCFALSACHGMGGFASGLGHLAGGLGHAAGGLGHVASGLGRVAAGVGRVVAVAAVRAAPVVVRVAADVATEEAIESTDATIEALTWGAITQIDVEPEYDVDADGVLYQRCDNAMLALVRTDGPPGETAPGPVIDGYCH